MSTTAIVPEQIDVPAPDAVAVDALRRRRARRRLGEADGDHGSLGSGKSTLMHILAGLDRPTSGSVRLDGVEITDWVAGRGARRDAASDRAVTRVSLKGLAARPVRAVLTALATVLGVAMVSGSFVVSDTITKAFRQAGACSPPRSRTRFGQYGVAFLFPAGSIVAFTVTAIVAGILAAVAPRATRVAARCPLRAAVRVTRGWWTEASAARRPPSSACPLGSTVRDNATGGAQMDVIAGIDAARERWNVLEHPFYTRWEQGELTREELACYAGEYRHAVVALARAARTARLHADEEAAHIALWDEFASALGTEAHEPFPQTRCCASAWAAADDELGAAAILYAIEAGQPAISETKLRGLVEHYGFRDDSPAVEYFAVHGERDHEHAAEARAALEGSKDPRLVALAETALVSNWALLDGVSTS